MVVSGRALLGPALLWFCCGGTEASDCILPTNTPFAKVRTVSTAKDLVEAFAEAPTDGSATKIIVASDKIDLKEADCTPSTATSACSHLTVRPGARIMLVGNPTGEGSRMVEITAGAVKAPAAFRRVLMVDGGNKGAGLFACNIDFTGGLLPTASGSGGDDGANGAAIFAGSFESRKEEVSRTK